MHFDRFDAMTTEIVFAAEGRKERVQLGFRDARAIIRDGERRFTRFSVDSELSRLNRSGGRWMQVSEDMYGLLEVARSLVEPTRGLFNPAVLPALVSSGYDRSIELIESDGPGPSLPPEMDAPLDFGSIDMEPDGRRVRLPRGMQVDLGGIAKGWLASKAARALGHFAESCAVSAGGDITLIGLPNGASAWSIGVENPLRPERDIVTINVPSGSVATSSVAKRRWTQGETTQHHIIDPRSGKPSDSPWLSVTVSAADACEAEAFAKACLIGGPELARELVKDRPEIAYLGVDQDGQTQSTFQSQEHTNVTRLEI
jgi:thiamine biosynthesis lipoprotein